MVYLMLKHAKYPRKALRTANSKPCLIDTYSSQITPLALTDNSVTSVMSWNLSLCIKLGIKHNSKLSSKETISKLCLVISTMQLNREMSFPFRGVHGLRPSHNKTCMSTWIQVHSWHNVVIVLYESFYFICFLSSAILSKKECREQIRTYRF